MKKSHHKKVKETSSKRQDNSEKDTVQFTDKERKAEDVANKQTRGGFD